MKLHQKIGALLLCGVLCFTACGKQGAEQSITHSPENPVVVTIWHYYNGAQKEAFSDLVEQFNATQGAEMGIVVEEYSQATVAELEQSVLESAQKKVGAKELPTIFAAYADTAYMVDAMGILTDISQYLSPEEMAEYVPGYLEEGRFGTDGSLKIFPVAKSTEIFMLNQTDWEKFASATGATPADFASMEGLLTTAKAYYEWTDAKTPQIAHDGQAFFGRDAFANYMIIGALQLGTELFSSKDGMMQLNFDKEVVRILWDSYYVPYISGYFAATNRFRSDDLKVGELISFVGSSSGATFFPTERIVNDTESYPIEMQVFAAPQFEGEQDVAVQQGAGMVVTKTTPQEMSASIVFLKWFTEPQRNVQFSVTSGYLPVTNTANNIDFILQETEKENFNEKLRNVLQAAIETTTQNEMYTTKAFAGGKTARNILETAMPEKAQQDRADVEQLLENGSTLEQAVTQINTQENFDAWYEATLQKLMAQM